ncbi:M23 family metallopeptidase [uncultured Maricaulis sp.]|uniref:M23 family metallopeptidase n=1 Tax=uncultured Maricaulis sp. TaxID=174710 RepID=UPI0030DBEC8D|tara:strand:+ start:387 stop:1304 length:918 start_codon:yes stop_codon:yes gene_type:complete
MIALIAALALQAEVASAPLDPIAEMIAAQSPDAAEVAAMPAPMAQAPVQGCAGGFVEGALLICHFGPDSRVTLGDVTADTDASGWAVIGIPRDAPREMRFTVAGAGMAERIDRMQAITQREFAIQRIEGVPQSTVTPDPSTLPRRQREYAEKQAAFASHWDGTGFLGGFTRPAEGITTGVYGSQRIYNGTAGNPHWGLDWANDPGTPVTAPASGRVVLAEPDMYYEGGLVFIDHGHGLISCFLHMSAVHVAVGDMVEQGQLIGEIGSGGRATGPHLDWRVKFQNSFYVDPALLLELDPAAIQTVE